MDEEQSQSTKRTVLPTIFMTRNGLLGQRSKRPEKRKTTKEAVINNPRTAPHNNSSLDSTEALRIPCVLKLPGNCYECGIIGYLRSDHNIISGINVQKEKSDKISTSLNELSYLVKATKT